MKRWLFVLVFGYFTKKKKELFHHLNFYLNFIIYVYIHLYELEVKHSHKISTKNEKLKTDEPQYSQHKNQKTTKWAKLNWELNGKCLNPLTSSGTMQKNLG